MTRMWFSGYPERDGELRAAEMRDLGRGRERQGFVAGVPVCDEAARFDRGRRQPLVEQALFDDDVRARERGVGIADAHRHAEGHVRPELVVDVGSAVQRLERIDDDRKLLVLDGYELGGVADRVRVFTDHDRNRLADVTHRSDR